MGPNPPGANGASGQPRPTSPTPFRRVIRHFERTLGAGILVMLPIGITVLVLKFIFDMLNPILEPAIAYLPGPQAPGFGIVALLILIYLVGLVAAFVLGRRLISIGHRILEVIPLVKGIYSTTRTAVQLLARGDDAKRYAGVVWVEFPRTGVWMIGLVTSSNPFRDGNDILSIYIPTTPIPSSGFLVLVPADQVQETDMTVEEAMSLVISGGILTERVFQRAGVDAPSDAEPDL